MVLRTAYPYFAFVSMAVLYIFGSRIATVWTCLSRETSSGYCVLCGVFKGQPVTSLRQTLNKSFIRIPGMAIAANRKGLLGLIGRGAVCINLLTLVS